MARDVLFLDKDDTLGRIVRNKSGESWKYFPGAQAFVCFQAQKKRSIYITTTASQEGASHLKDLRSSLAGYLGIEHIDRRKFPLRMPDGTPLTIYHGFRKIAHRRWQRLGTEEIVDDDFFASHYHRNPYCDEEHLKDIHFARLYVDKTNPESLRTVMVGDENDRRSAESDPFTPLFVTWCRVEPEQQWAAATAAVDHLFDGDELPWARFDKLYAAAEPLPCNMRRIRLEQIDFDMVQGRGGTRLLCLTTPKGGTYRLA